LESTEIIEPCQPDSLSLEDLVGILKSQQGVPELDHIFGWLRSLKVTPEEIEPFIGFKEGNYSRHRVCRNEFVEMLVLSWRPGHRTPIHDHTRSHGGVCICAGRLWETIFTYDAEQGLEYKTAREHSAGGVTGSDIPDIHQLGNPDVSEQNLITIHVYAPPLGVLHTYKPGSVKIDLYVPDDLENLN